ncbi:MAG: nucleotide exchange factor GrpE [Methanosarcinaceae archaeon]|nr:nucleotide exchange factor GrpE [Methanosarcinaceae archaeon]
MADESNENEKMDSESVKTGEKGLDEEQLKEDEVAKLKDQLLRLSAEFDNFRKRSIREKEEYRKFAIENIMIELLEVCDNFERALDSAKKAESVDSVIEGVEMVFNQFVSILKKEGLERIKCEGCEFDPHMHEAMTHIETSEQQDNTIFEVHRSGYMLHSKVIRPAMVTVVKNPEED